MRSLRPGPFKSLFLWQEPSPGYQIPSSSSSSSEDKFVGGRENEEVIGQIVDFIGFTIGVSLLDYYSIIVVKTNVSHCTKLGSFQAHVQMRHGYDQV